MSEGRWWLEELGLGLGIWQGSYKNVSGSWLRFYDEAGNWIPTPMEIVEQLRQQKEQVQQQIERESR